MPKRAIPLTKLTKQKRWRKKYKGVQYYLPFSKYPTREAAWLGWLSLKARLDTERQAGKPHKEEYGQAIKTRHDLAAVARELGNEEAARLFSNDAERLLQVFNASDSPPALSPHDENALFPLEHRMVDEMFGNLTKEQREAYPGSPYSAPPILEMRTIYLDRLKRLQATAADKTLSAAVASFLERTAAKANAGEISKVRWSSLHAHLKCFTEWAGPSFATEDISSKTLQDFHSHLIHLIGRGDITRAYAHSVMVSVKHFIKWAFRLDLCPFPKNLDGHDLGFKVSPPTITPFTDDEVKTLLGKGSERTELYCLLALNCGFTQGDIAQLRQDEVNWGSQTITRKRTKTRDHKNVPTVSYPLWQTTYDLLAKHRAPTGDFMLVNARGGSLKTEAITAGKFHKTDNVRNAFNRLLAKVGMKDKAFKVWRKTGASKLAEHETHRHSRYLYLGHSPRSIADKHYSVPSQALFNEAIRWLGEKFGIK